MGHLKTLSQWNSKLLCLAQQFNNFYLTGLQNGEACPFLIEGQQLGFIKLYVLNELCKYPDIFCISKCKQTRQFVVELNPALETYALRTERLGNLLSNWRHADTFPTLRGWRDENFKVKTNLKSMLEMEREATPIFGIRRYGVHINGYVQHPKHGLCIWLQQRSNTKSTWPGKWDNLVGGGVASDYGIKETVVKEAAEEANITGELMQKMVSTGSVSMFYENHLGLYPNTEYVFDLELPLDFQPKNTDDEVQAFELLTVEECMQRLLSQEFKITSAPVIIDFLLRRGYITPAYVEQSFMDIIELLHVPLESLYSYRKIVKSK